MLASKSAVLRRRPLFWPDASLLSRDAGLVALADLLSLGAGLSAGFVSFGASFVSLGADFVPLGAAFVPLGAGFVALGAGFVPLGAGLESCSATAIGLVGAPTAASLGASVEARLPVRLRLIVRS
jgi:hypothetical protein